MSEISAEARDRYYAELSIRLREAGFEPRPQEDGLLPVDWQGFRLCRLTAGGGAQFREAELDREGGRAAFDRAVDIAREVRQYMDLIAPRQIKPQNSSALSIKIPPKSQVALS